MSDLTFSLSVGIMTTATTTVATERSVFMVMVVAHPSCWEALLVLCDSVLDPLFTEDTRRQTPLSCLLCYKVQSKKLLAFSV